MASLVADSASDWSLGCRGIAAEGVGCSCACFIGDASLRMTAGASGGALANAVPAGFSGSTGASPSGERRIFPGKEPAAIAGTLPTDSAGLSVGSSGFSVTVADFASGGMRGGGNVY